MNGSIAHARTRPSTPQHLAQARRASQTGQMGRTLRHLVGADPEGREENRRQGTARLATVNAFRDRILSVYRPFNVPHVLANGVLVRSPRHHHRAYAQGVSNIRYITVPEAFLEQFTVALVGGELTVVSFDADKGDTMTLAPAELSGEFYCDGCSAIMIPPPPPMPESDQGQRTQDGAGEGPGVGGGDEGEGGEGEDEDEDEGENRGADEEKEGEANGAAAGVGAGAAADEDTLMGSCQSCAEPVFSKSTRGLQCGQLCGEERLVCYSCVHRPRSLVGKDNKELDEIRKALGSKKKASQVRSKTARLNDIQDLMNQARRKRLETSQRARNLQREVRQTGQSADGRTGALSVEDTRVGTMFR